MEKRRYKKFLKILIAIFIVILISFCIYVILKYIQKPISLAPPVHSVARSFDKKLVLLDEEIIVNLTVDTADGNDSVYTIEEKIPRGVVVVNSGDGHVVGNKIKWVVYNSNGSPVVDAVHTYIIKISNVGNYTITGKYAFNSEKLSDILGDSILEVVSCIPKPEVCDNIDNDCDGKIDNGLDPNNCQSTCIQEGYNWTNNNGTLNCCGDDLKEAFPYQPNESSPLNLCSDTNDNDCDGKIDLADFDCYACNPGVEVKDCPKQQGVCLGSKETCNSRGQWDGCNDSVYLSYTPLYEVNETKCDNIDNNCDGVTDEDPILLCISLGEYICISGSCICNSSYEEDTSLFQGNCDGCVSPKELSDYVYEWKINDNPEITQEEVTSAVYIYLKEGSAC